MPARKKLLTQLVDRELRASELPATTMATVAKLAATGWTEKGIARQLGIDEKTWRRLKAEEPLIADALDQGREEEHHALFTKLYDKAMKGDGDTIALLFLLKARHGYKEGSEVAPNQVAVVFQVPGALSPEQWRAMREIEKKGGAVDGEVVG